MSKIEEVQESAANNQQENEEIVPNFTPKEIAELLEAAEQHKSTGNKFFSIQKFEEAIEQYKKALDTCPVEKKEERAVYWGNIGACEVKLNKHKEAVDACTKALEDDPAYTKVLFRRAQANEKINTLISTNSALEDYKKLSSDPIHKSDRIVLDNRSLISNAIKRLPPKIKELEEKEKAEMIDKLKGFGNTILGKFGLSTDNFQMMQNENGSYNVQFVNSPDKNGESGN